MSPVAETCIESLEVTWLVKDKDVSLGLLGPTLRAKVGDTIKITFKNNCGFTTSLHPHGVFYEKNSEGSPYDDGTSEGDPFPKQFAFKHYSMPRLSAAD